MKIIAELVDKDDSLVTEIGLIANPQFSLMGMPWQIEYEGVLYTYQSQGLAFTLGSDEVKVEIRYRSEP